MEKQNSVVEISNTEEIEENINEIEKQVGEFEQQISNESKTCKHYQKSCYKFYFECCGIYDPCKKCHLERNIHKSRKGMIVSEITCSTCETAQKPSQVCIECKTKFSNSYCGLCHVWTEDEINHCEKCGVCRLKTSGKIYIHDDSQGCCIEFTPDKYKKKYKNKVINIKSSYCVICKDNTFPSLQSCRVIPCGHIMHFECGEKYFKPTIDSYTLQYKIQYQCPVPDCKKTVRDMTCIWDKMRQHNKEYPIPQGCGTAKIDSIVGSDFGRFQIESIRDNQMYSGVFIDWTLGNGQKVRATLSKNSIKPELQYLPIYCYDCENTDYALFHFTGLECVKCSSFNTNVIIQPLSTTHARTLTYLKNICKYVA